MTTASTNAIEITAPVFWSIVRVPGRDSAPAGRHRPIIAAVLGLLNIPEPIPTRPSQSVLCQ